MEMEREREREVKMRSQKEGRNGGTPDSTSLSSLESRVQTVRPE